MVNGGPIKFEIDVLIKSEIIMRINVILSDISSASAVGGPSYMCMTLHYGTEIKIRDHLIWQI